MGTRRTFTAQFKLETVLEFLAGHKGIAQICRERQLTEKLVYDWKRAFSERASAIFDTTATANDAQARIAELERLVGCLTLENEILKKVGTLSRSPATRNGR